MFIFLNSWLKIYFNFTTSSSKTFIFIITKKISHSPFARIFSVGIFASGIHPVYISLNSTRFSQRHCEHVNNGHKYRAGEKTVTPNNLCFISRWASHRTSCRGFYTILRKTRCVNGRFWSPTPSQHANCSHFLLYIMFWYYMFLIVKTYSCKI